MTLKERLESCKKCNLRKFGDTGIVCSLTNNKPNFNGHCNHFVIDEKAAKREERLYANNEVAEGSLFDSDQYETKEEKSTSSIWTIVIVVVIILKIILRTMRD